jgi:hypothetical protein
MREDDVFLEMVEAATTEPQPQTSLRNNYRILQPSA